MKYSIILIIQNISPKKYVFKLIMVDFDLNLDKRFDIYSGKYKLEVAISCQLFILFFIAHSIDFNTILKDFGVSSAPVNRGKLIYVYLFGYATFVMKFFLAYLLFSVMVLVIVIIFTSLFSVILVNVVDQTGEIERIKAIIKIAMVNMGRFLIGFISMHQFFLVFLVMIPVFLLIFYLFFAVIIYQPKKLEEDDENKAKVMETNHIYLFFLFTSLAIMAIFYIVTVYNYEILSIKPEQ